MTLPLGLLRKTTPCASISADFSCKLVSQIIAEEAWHSMVPVLLVSIFIKILHANKEPNWKPLSVATTASETCLDESGLSQHLKINNYEVFWVDTLHHSAGDVLKESLH